MHNGNLDNLTDEDLATVEAGELPPLAEEGQDIDDVNVNVDVDVDVDDEILGNEELDPEDDWDSESEFGDGELEDLIDRGPEIEGSHADGEVDDSIFEGNMEVDPVIDSEPELEF